MVSDETRAVISRANAIYEQRLKADLEALHPDCFVAIEPDSGHYLVGPTFDEAVRLARASHPTKLTHTIRIGHVAAFQLGRCAVDRISLRRLAECRSSR